MNKIDLKTLTSIDDDFALWAAEQAALLRASKLDRVDLENVAEELDYLGNSQESEIESRLVVLLAHLLKWHFQPERRSNSWRATLLEQRRQIGKIIKRSPSLRQHPAKQVPEAYEIGVLAASGETNLPLSAFPKTCPYSIEQILDLTFFPGPTDDR